MSEASTVAEAPISTVAARAVGRPVKEGAVTGRQVVTGEAPRLPSRHRE